MTADQANGSKAPGLEILARQAGFDNLGKAELALLQAGPTGDWADCNPAGLSFLASWKSEHRKIRASLLRWLCTDPDASKRVNRKGLFVWRASIAGALDLSYSEISFPLTFDHCLFQDALILDWATLPTLTLSGSHLRSLRANRLQTKGDVSLDNGFRAKQGVQLYGANIGVGLVCSGARLGSNAEGVALDATDLNARGSVFLDRQFKAIGECRFYACQIGSLNCSGATLTNGGAAALNFEGAKVDGHALLKEASIEGEARFYAAQIKGNLECKGAKLNNLQPSDESAALNFVRADVTGSVFLDEGCSVSGEVRAYGAQIGGDLFASGATLSNPGGVALDAQNLRVTGDVNLEKAVVEGEVLALGAQIDGDFDCSAGGFSHLSLRRTTIRGTLRLRKLQAASRLHLDLSNASAAFLDDDDGSWPSGEAGVVLDGFEYGRISGPATDAKSRLKWLDAQSKGPDQQGAGAAPRFLPQPYRQLAKALSASGDDDGSRRVLFEMEALRRRQSETRWWQQAWNRVLRASIGFGVYPVWAIRWLIALTILATGVFGVGYLNGSIVPGDKDANSVFTQQGAPPGYYPRFNALIYAMENTVPLLKFGQDGAWIPNPTKPVRRPALSPGTFARCAASAVKCLGWLTPPFLLVWFRWLLIIVGWILGTLFLAGVTGIVRGS